MQYIRKSLQARPSGESTLAFPMMEAQHFNVAGKAMQKNTEGKRKTKKQVISRSEAPHHWVTLALEHPRTKSLCGISIAEIITGLDSGFNHLNLKAPTGSALLILEVIIRFKVTVFIWRAAGS